jgi:hypothetical protein
VRKRKVNYPAPKTANKPTRTVGLTTSPTYTRSTVATINLAALEVRDDYSAGDRVRIGGEGLYSGELAVIESIVVGVIPAAMVRTEAGKSRRVRFVDLERVAAERAPAPDAPAPAAPAPAASAPEAISAEG